MKNQYFRTFVLGNKLVYISCLPRNHFNSRVVDFFLKFGIQKQVFLTKYLLI
jgi:hypothetical protein